MEIDNTKYDIRFYICPHQRMVMFNSKNIDMFPGVKAKLLNVLLNNLNPNGVIFLYISQGGEITIDNIDTLDIDSVAIVDPLNGGEVISEIYSSSGKIDNLLQTIVSIFDKVSLWIKVKENDWNQITFNYLIEFGFAKPVMMDNNIYMKYKRPVSKRTIVQKLEAMISSVQTNKAVLKVKFPKSMASLFSTYVHKEFEVSGKIAIKSYDDNKVATLAFDKFTLIEGSKENFVTPLAEKAPLSFHTHPDVCYIEYGCFVGWPSGQDMGVIPYRYLMNDDILAHFVVSAEGIWVMHLSYDFQKILYQLKARSDDECGNQLIEAIGNKFGNVETSRQYKNVNPMERHIIKANYIDMVNSYKLTNLANDIPELVNKCNLSITNDSLLYNIELIKWKTFTESDGIQMEFDYFPDPDGGLPAYLPTDSIVQCAL